MNSQIDNTFTSLLLEYIACEMIWRLLCLECKEEEWKIMNRSSQWITLVASILGGGGRKVGNSNIQNVTLMCVVNLSNTKLFIRWDGQ